MSTAATEGRRLPGEDMVRILTRKIWRAPSPLAAALHICFWRVDAHERSLYQTFACEYLFCHHCPHMTGDNLAACGRRWFRDVWIGAMKNEESNADTGWLLFQGVECCSSVESSLESLEYGSTMMKLKVPLSNSGGQKSQCRARVRGDRQLIYLE